MFYAGFDRHLLGLQLQAAEDGKKTLYQIMTSYVIIFFYEININLIDRKIILQVLRILY